MKFKDLLKQNRSYRRFEEEVVIPEEVLMDVVENLRYVPSAANLQPLKYLMVNKVDRCNEIFPTLKWAGYLSEWPGPVEGERPSAYIAILGDRKLSPYVDWDYGIALQTILLSLVNSGYGGCAIAAFDKKRVREVLDIEPAYEILGIVAAGKPAEKVVIDDFEDSVKYWRDEDGTHHVPKKGLQHMIYKFIK